MTVGNNLPDANAQDAAGTQSSDRSSRTEETVNYEVSKTTQTHVREAGLVKRISVAVLVDGLYETAADGAVTYTPRSADELAQLEKLVRSAAGYDEQRGDKIEIVNMRFAPEEQAVATDDPTLLMGFERHDIMRIAEMLVLGLLLLVILLFVVRPMVGRMLPSPALALAGVGPDGQALLTDQSAAQLALAGPAGAAQNALSPTSSLASEIEQMIDLNQVEGQIRASSLKKISEIVEKHPEAAVNILRGWMYAERN